MGNTIYKKASFRDVIYAFDKSSFVIINTLPINQQHCLITNTIPLESEELVMNKLLSLNKDINIIVYGKNSNDETTEKKCAQLFNIGFKNVYCFTGGLYEWMLLQDIYGDENFPTTSKCIDILVYKPDDCFSSNLLKYI
jgi:hypothetical protein